MIITYDTSLETWSLLCAGDKYFYDSTASHVEKIRNIVAEFPPILSESLKNKQYEIDIREERWVQKKNEEPSKCKFVSFNLRID